MGLFTRKRPSKRGAFLAHLLAMDRALVAHEFPALSPWWRSEVERFLTSDASTWVVRVGRRGGKSTTWAKLAIAWAVYGPWSVPPGDVGVIPFVSVSRDEAAARLRTIEAMLTALGIGYARRGDEVELRDRRCVFRVVSATTMSVVGFTSIMVVGDEVARWRDSDGVANPAREVVSSLRPTLATQAVHGAFTVLSSAPWVETDYHAERFDAGDGAGQLVSYAPTWVANPTITEAQTHELEPDPRVHAREYEALPQSSISGAWPDGCDHVIAKGITHRPYQRATYGVVFDLGEQKSASTAMAFHFELRAAQHGAAVLRTLVIDAIRVLKPTMFRRVTFEHQVRLIADMCREYHVTSPRGDRHLHSALGDPLTRLGVVLTREPLGMSLGEQAARSTALLDHVRAGSLDCIDHPDAVAQLRGAVLRERGGKFVIETTSKRTHPDDVLDLILAACDPEFRKIEATGGNVIYVDAEINWSTREVVREGYYARQDANGRMYPVETPRSAPEYREHQRQRWIQGHVTQGDIDEYGPEIVARVARGNFPTDDDD